MAAQNEPNFALFTSWNGGIINPLFDGLTYNMSGHFAHCSNKVYVFHKLN